MAKSSFQLELVSCSIVSCPQSQPRGYFSNRVVLKMGFENLKNKFLRNFEIFRTYPFSSHRACLAHELVLALLELYPLDFPNQEDYRTFSRVRREIQN